MSQRTATITGLPMAFEVVKAMQADCLERSAGYRHVGWRVLEEAIEDRMAATVDRRLDQLEADDPADQHNGHSRHRLTQLGDIELCVPRIRRYSPVQVIRVYARRTREFDHGRRAGAGEWNKRQRRAIYLERHGLQPHRYGQFKFSTDPDFVAELRDVVEIYVGAPALAIVLSVNEKSQSRPLTYPARPTLKKVGSAP